MIGSFIVAHVQIQRAVAGKCAVPPQSSTLAVSLDVIGRPGASGVPVECQRPELRRVPACLAACLSHERGGEPLRAADLEHILFDNKVGPVPATRLSIQLSPALSLLLTAQTLTARSPTSLKGLSCRLHPDGSGPHL